MRKYTFLIFEITSEPVSILVYLKPQCKGGQPWLSYGLGELGETCDSYNSYQSSIRVGLVNVNQEILFDYKQLVSMTVGSMNVCFDQNFTQPNCFLLS